MVSFPSDPIMCVNYLRDLVWTKFKSISLNYALSMSTGSATSCVSTPSATEGLYYVSGMSFRKNITEGKSGLPVILELTIVNKTTCEPIPGAIVEIWPPVMHSESTVTMKKQATTFKIHRPMTRHICAANNTPTRVVLPPLKPFTQDGM